MSESQLAVAGPKASDQLASFLGIEKGMMLETLKAQCFKGKRPDEVSDAQLAAFVSTANVLQVNPLVPGMLWAFPERNGGITPILGPDGVMKKLDEHIATGKLEGYDCVVYPEDVTQKPTHAVATIYRRDARPAIFTALFSEWVVGNSPVWTSKPRHMLWMRAIKQCARQVIHGLPMDAEEYASTEMQNVTPEPVNPAAPRPEPPKRAKRGAAAVVDAVTEEVPKVAEPVAAEPVTAPAQVEEQYQAGQRAAEAREVAQHAPASTTPAEAPVPTPAATPRVFLHENEEVTVDVKVTAITTFWAKRDGVRHPSIKAAVKGGFNNDVIHLGGGTSADNENITVGSLWKVGADLRLTLKGELNKQEPGSTRAFVQKVESVQEEF